MLSAFGVDHGEISKGRAKTTAQIATRARASNIGTTGPQKFKRGLNRVGEADVSLKGIGRAAGQGMKKVGGFLEKRPGLTGTALVGGGGAAGYKVLSDKEPKRKKTS